MFANVFIKSHANSKYDGNSGIQKYNNVWVVPGELSTLRKPTEQRGDRARTKPAAWGGKPELVHNPTLFLVCFLTFQ